MSPEWYDVGAYTPLVLRQEQVWQHLAVALVEAQVKPDLSARLTLARVPMKSRWYPAASDSLESSFTRRDTRGHPSSLPSLPPQCLQPFGKGEAMAASPLPTKMQPLVPRPARSARSALCLPPSIFTLDPKILWQVLWPWRVSAA